MISYNQLALRARWLFYHFISNSGSWNNCYIVVPLLRVQNLCKVTQFEAFNKGSLLFTYLMSIAAGNYLNPCVIADKATEFQHFLIISV